MKNVDQAISKAITELSKKYNIEATEDQAQAVLDGLDETGQDWLPTAPVNDISEYIVGVLCNTLPDRRGNY